MKHEQEFDKFLSREVNLNASRLTDLNRRVTYVTSLLKDLDSFKRVERQGSYALGTIIKPVEGRGYDADILLHMHYSPGKEPKDYIRDVYKRLKRDKDYSDKVHLATRCAYIEYVGDFHLDIVPCVTKGKQIFIFNGRDNKIEVTDGIGYRDWLNQKNEITDGQLKKVTKLLKYLRDHKNNFLVKSILLTTLVGLNVHDNEVGSKAYTDTPTALKTISNRINSFLQNNERMPTIRNPALRSEKFTRRWDQKKYSQFRKMFNIYNGKINEAFDATDPDESIAKWQKLFGRNFG